MVGVDADWTGGLASPQLQQAAWSIQYGSLWESFLTWLLPSPKPLQETVFRHSTEMHRDSCCLSLLGGMSLPGSQGVDTESSPHGRDIGELGTMRDLMANLSPSPSGDLRLSTGHMSHESSFFLWVLSCLHLPSEFRSHPCSGDLNLDRA